MPTEQSSLSKSDQEWLSDLVMRDLDGYWERANDFGIWLREEDLPTLDDYDRSQAREWFGNIASESRLKELRRGAEPTSAEVAAYQKEWMEQQLDTGGDADDIPGYALSMVKDGPLTGTALILRRGYSFSEVTTWLEGVFASDQEALDYMREGGWLDP